MEELDYSKIWGDGVEASEYLPKAIQKYGVGGSVNIGVLGWNTNQFPGDKAPKSWADFYDVKKFPGPRAIPNWGTPEWVFWTALLADGVSPDKLVPIDYDRAIKVMDRIKPELRLAYKSGDHFMNAMTGQEVTLVIGTGSRCGSAKQLGGPIAWTWNQGIGMIGFAGILKGAPNLENAYRYLKIYVRPENQVKYAEHLNQPTPNTKYISYLPEELRPKQAMYPDNVKHLLWPYWIDMKWLSDHKQEIAERYQTWLTQ
jgi:mannopine transport system substrate-binding protein